jgi:hypothetical protein
VYSKSAVCFVVFVFAAQSLELIEFGVDRQPQLALVFEVLVLEGEACRPSKLDLLTPPDGSACVFVCVVVCV